MGSYYYVTDIKSELGYTPISEEDYVGAIIRIAKRKGIKISDKMILEEITKKILTRGKKNAIINTLKSPALVY